MRNSSILALDVGERRIGIAWADGALRIPFPLVTIAAEAVPIIKIKEIYEDQRAGLIVVGLPRNQQGEETAQSKFARDFAASLEKEGLPITFQDESLTSVLAEDELKKRGKPYKKEDIDSLAATLILQDYLESGEGRA